MLTRILHWLVAHPVVYDAVQLAAGARQVERVLREELARLRPAGRVLDLGGGTGGWKALFAAGAQHVCLDRDRLKLHGFARKFPGGAAVLADARALPFADGAFDLVWCAFVPHHLDDLALRHVLDEAARVLRPDGRLVLVDPLFVADRWPGRLLWRYDRGRHPRTLAAHRAALAPRFELLHERRFTVLHAYALFVARPRTYAGG